MVINAIDFSLLLEMTRAQSFLNRPLKNVFEAADARQKQAKKRSLCVINEHFELVFNTAAATQIVFQRPVKSPQSPARRRVADCLISARRSVAAVAVQRIEFLRRARSG